MTGITEVPISIAMCPVPTAALIGTRVVPSVDETPHQMGVLFSSRITPVELCIKENADTPSREWPPCVTGLPYVELF